MPKSPEFPAAEGAFGKKEGRALVAAKHGLLLAHLARSDTASSMSQLGWLTFGAGLWFDIPSSSDLLPLHLWHASKAL